MDALDQQVSDMIRQSQDQTLGHEAPRDPQPLSQRPADARPSDRAYEYSPATNNPSRDALPADTAPARELSQDPTQVRMPVTQAEMDAKAPDVLELDLQKSLATAIASSREYRTQRENLYLTALSVLAEKHLWGPRFFSSVSTIVEGTPEDGEHDQALNVIGQLGVTQRLPYGGSVSATALVNFVNLLKDTSGGAGEGQDAALLLSARLPLLRGAGQAARENLIQVYRNLIYATRDFERFRREFMLDISTRYFDLLQSQAQIANLQRQVNNLEWLSSRIEAMANAGRQPFFEVQRAQQQVLFARNNLLNAQESYASSLDAFKIQLGIDTMQPLRIVPAEIVIPEPALEVNSATAVALDLRLDLQISKDRVEDARRRVAVARNGLLPDLDLVADLRLNTDPTDRYAGFNLDPSRSSYSAGAILELPLDRKLEEIAVRRSLVDLERSVRSHDLLRNRVSQQVRQSIREINQARFTLEIQNQNISMAQKRLEGVVLRLAQLAPRDFTEAEEDLLEARNRRDRALRDFRVSILQYLLDTGQLRVSAQGQWLPPANLVPLQNTDGQEMQSPGDYYDQSGSTTQPAGANNGGMDASPAQGKPTGETSSPMLPGDGSGEPAEHALDPTKPAIEQPVPPAVDAPGASSAAADTGAAQPEADASPADADAPEEPALP